MYSILIRIYNTFNQAINNRMNSNLAVLIDGDNIPSAHVKEMMEEIAKYGNPTIKRIYGDWTSPHLSKWKNLLLQNAITPIQQYAYTTGKNATDSAMIIDAMDILYSEKVNGFCLVSSDSDFTKLATRLREAGMQVIGIGEKKTPIPFIVACDKFIYIEILRNQANKKESINKKDEIEEARFKDELEARLNRDLQAYLGNNRFIIHVEAELKKTRTIVKETTGSSSSSSSSCW